MCRDTGIHRYTMGKQSGNQCKARNGGSHADGGAERDGADGEEQGKAVLVHPKWTSRGYKA